MAAGPQPPLRVLQEGTSARATTGRLNFLFRDSQSHTIEEAFDRLILRADSHFSPRWNAYRGANITPAAFNEILQEITLHWMYVCALHRLPLEIMDADWEHPQTLRIIQSGVSRHFMPDSEGAVPLTAHLMGISEVEYLNWRDSDDAFLSFW